jgi:hypothetical protein
MLRRAFRPVVFLALLALLAAGMLARPAGADNSRIEGSITAVDGGYITVRADNGHEQRFHIGNRTHVVFQSSADAAAFPNAKVDVLAPGMRVRVNPNAMAGAVLDRVHVLSMPDSARPVPPAAAAVTPAPVAAGGVVKARLQNVDTRRGVVKADVAGRSQTYRVRSPYGLGSFHAGDLVLLTFDRDGNVSDIRAATQLGRVTRIAGSSVTIQMDGREEDYVLANKVGRGLRVGDSVRFEFEDRPGGQKVITDIR